MSKPIGSVFVLLWRSAGCAGPVAACLLALADQASSQVGLQVIQSNTPASNESFGAAVAAAPLTNVMPGNTDWILVGVPNATNGGLLAAGEVECFAPPGNPFPSFAFGAPASQLQGGAHFGFAIVTGDINGDGYADVVVGAPDRDNGTGSGLRTDEGEAFVFFGPWSPTAPQPYADWCRMSPQERNTATQPGAQFGWSLALGRLHGGSDDVVVGIPGATLNTSGGPRTNAGAVDVFLSLAPNGGSPIVFRDQHLAPSPSTALQGDRMGHAVAIGQFAIGVGLTAGSAWPDIAASAPFADHVTSTTMTDAGAVDFFYGQNVGGAPVWNSASSTYFEQQWAPFAVLSGTGADNQHYGTSIDATDYDQNGWSDLAVGATSTSPGPAPYVALLRGRNSGVFMNLLPPDILLVPSAYRVTNNLYGAQVRWVRNNTTAPVDLMVSMVTTKSGLANQVDLVFLYSGSPSSLATWSNTSTIHDSFPTVGDAKFGAALCRARSWGTAVDQIVIGAPQSDLPGTTAAGRVEVH